MTGFAHSSVLIVEGEVEEKLEKPNFNTIIVLMELNIKMFRTTCQIT